MAKIDEGFTQKEMLIRMMDKLENIESKLNQTHEQACTTNGKVRLHTKLIFLIIGAIITIVTTGLGLFFRGF